MTEWGNPKKVLLNESERRALARFDRQLTTSYDADGSAIIGPSQGFVGSASLSDRTLVVVQPKVPIRNLVDLIALAVRTEPVPPSLGDTLLEKSDPTDWLAVLLIAEVERLASRGLRRGYVEVSDQLPYVKGRIRFDRLAALSNPSMLLCEFADFIQDTAENRILRGTLEVVALSKLQPLLKARVLQLLDAFDQVIVIRPSLAMFDRLHISALNRHYEPALRICRLFLETAGVETDPGDVGAPAFFLPMERIFQEAVANYLSTQLVGLRAQPSYSEAFTHISGTPIRKIAIKPDMILDIGPARHELVLDTKYKRPLIANMYGQRIFRSDDIYQVVAYALALQCPGVLIYPQDDEPIAATYTVSGQRFNIISVDLNRPRLGGLVNLADSVRRLASRAHPQELEPPQHMQPRSTF